MPWNTMGVYAPWRFFQGKGVSCPGQCMCPLQDDKSYGCYYCWQAWKAAKPTSVCDPSVCDHLTPRLTIMLADEGERSADRRDFPRDLLQDPPEARAHEDTMQSATRQWLDYTDNLLAAENEASKEIKLIMGVTRGPDYVRLNGGEVSPRAEDRLPIKKVTTAVLRAAFFPKAAKAANKAAQLIAKLRSEFGVSEAKAQAVAGLLDVKPTSNWLVAAPGTQLASTAVLDNQLGSQSHFTIKVKQAAALLGIYR